MYTYHKYTDTQPVAPTLWHGWTCCPQCYKWLCRGRGRAPWV